MNILEVTDLCKTYGTGEAAVHALNHVSFSAAKGELIGRALIARPTLIMADGVLRDLGVAS